MCKGHRKGHAKVMGCTWRHCELTSCSDKPSMISETSCSLRAADMESPLPRWPTLLETRGTQSGPAVLLRG